MYTMFTVSSVDGWQELVVIPMSEDSTTVPENALIWIFFVSFIIIVVWTILPVVIAILLESFSSAAYELEQISLRESMGVDEKHNSLDPVYESLSQYDTDLDLEQKIQNLFDAMLGERSDGKISYVEMSSALRRSSFGDGQLRMSADDYACFTAQGTYSDEDGCMDRGQFEMAVKSNLKRYAQRALAKQHVLCASTGGQEMNEALLMALKLQFLQHDRASDTTSILRGHVIKQRKMTIANPSPMDCIGNPLQPSPLGIKPTAPSNFSNDLDEDEARGLWQSRIEKTMSDLSASVNNMQSAIVELSAQVEALSSSTQKILGNASQQPVAAVADVAIPNVIYNNESHSTLTHAGAKASSHSMSTKVPGAASKHLTRVPVEGLSGEKMTKDATHRPRPLSETCAVELDKLYQAAIHEIEGTMSAGPDLRPRPSREDGVLASLGVIEFGDQFQEAVHESPVLSGQDLERQMLMR